MLNDPFNTCATRCRVHVLPLDPREWEEHILKNVGLVRCYRALSVIELSILWS